MNRSIASSPAASHEDPTRLPVQTEDLTAGQTARVSGGRIRWWNIFGELFGADPPETGDSGSVL